MSSSGDSCGTPKPADLFEDLWKQLGDCHQNTVQELEAKVSKLKKDRCLDAQRLEVFYNRNQQLKEQNKTLQDTISLLEERLRAGECDRCAVLEENLKNSEDQNQQLIAKLENERDGLKDENRKLQAELEKLKASQSETREASSPEHEEGFIPDSPVLSSSLPLTNKLRKLKNVDNIKHVRYAERPLPLSDRSIFCEPHGATKAAGKAEVLVPNTCELDAPPISNVNEDMEEAIAETCGLELLDKHQRFSPQKMEFDQNGQSCLKTPWKHDVRLKPYCSSPSSAPTHSLDSTSDRSPSLLPCVRRFSEEGSVSGVKRKKEESDEEVVGGKGGVQAREDEQKKGKHVKPEGVNQSATCGSRRSINQELLSNKTGTSSQKTDRPCLSPTFKKPQSKATGDTDRKKGTPLPLCTSQSKHRTEDAGGKQPAEHMWSMDPALSLSVYDSEQGGHEEKEEPQRHGDLTDTDCTWISHSMLQHHRESRLGEKANDSLDLMFDTTACGEYKSFSTSELSQSQDYDDDDDENEEEEGIEQDPPESLTCQEKSRKPSFAHVAVIRKKDERRKLKGTTCKECEIFYAHLPEEEKQKKLSACSRHRFLYIPPCTPENFWEVGFPSTQTCIDRGYIKEEKSPQARLRRRQPLNALFSPMKNQKPS